MKTNQNNNKAGTGEGSVRLTAQRILTLALLAGAVGAWQTGQAAALCRIDPVSHQIGLLPQSGEGGIGGTGAPMPSLSAQSNNGSGGIGGTGAPLTVAQAGQVLFADGKVTASRSDGSRRELAQGAPVCEGDRLSTDTGGLLQLAMEDGGRLELGTDTRLSIDRFNLPASMDGSEGFHATLAQGSVRAKTGEIGHLHKELYAIATPLAEVKVRGTVHEVYHVPQALSGVPAGTYNRVLSGGTVLKAGGGALELRQAQTGYAPADGSAPRLLDHLPAALVRGSALTLSSAWRTLQQTTSPVEPALYNKPSQKIAQFFDLSTDTAPDGSAYAGANHDLANNEVRIGGVRTDLRNGSVIVIDPDWGLPVAAADTNNGYNFLLADWANLYQVDTAKVDGVDVIWGLYGPVSDVNPASGDLRNVDYHHFAFSPQGVTPGAVLHAQSGSASFDHLVGATTPSDESRGVGGQLNALSVGVQFGAQVKVTSFHVNLTDSQNRTWDASSTGSISLRDFRAGRLALSGQCSGDGCGSGAAGGSAAGVIIGKNGKGLITSYGLKTSSGQSVAGAAVLSRP
jgi:hypothetical protein